MLPTGPSPAPPPPLPNHTIPPATQFSLSGEPSYRDQRTPIPATSATVQHTHNLVSDPSVLQVGWIRRSRFPTLARDP